jgi:hypothetical protein
MAQFEIVQGKVSKCEKIQISDGMPAVSCIVANKAITIISLGIVPGIFEGDEVRVSLVYMDSLGGTFGVAYYNKTREQRYTIPTGQFQIMGMFFTVIGIVTAPMIIGIFFIYQGLKLLKYRKNIKAGSAALS